jgi:hypothetical protein
MKKHLIHLCTAAVIGLSGCGNDTTDKNQSNSTKETKQTEMNHESTGHSSMEHSSSAEVPTGLKEAENPTFKVGSQAIINADHMEGMKGAEATIVGAYDTTAYVVSYKPTTGGEMVKNHKWVIQEEIKNGGKETLKPGTEVTIEADHMKGMMGATGSIDSAEKTTVYMIDYTPTTGGEMVKNHKWVTESELTAK